MASQQPSFEGQGQPHSPASITEIDISGPARALAVLRWTDYTLVIACGLGVVGALPDLFSSIANRDWGALIGQLVIVAVMAFAAVTGWRHVGVIDPRVWRAYLWVFPTLAITGLLIAAVTVADWITRGTSILEEMQSLMAVLGGLWIAAIAMPGFVCVLLLRRTRMPPMDVQLGKLINGLHNRGGPMPPHIRSEERPGYRRGLAYSALGTIILLATTFAPIPESSKDVSMFYRVTSQLNALAFFVIVRARRHFQVSADSLLAIDNRPPILFLRSFADDEKQQYGNSQRALLDFSLETRLANHFCHFGPFIAVGSPKDTVPQPGAARVLLADDEWQSRVLGWMQSSSLIVMYCGTTKWVNWELSKIIESGRSTSLIMMIPEVKGWRASRRQQDVANRVGLLRDVFSQTPWNEELTECSDYQNLRAMLFRADGSMVMVRSRSRSRDSYHLAALIAHQQLLDPVPVNSQTEAVVRVRESRRSWRKPVLIAGIAAAAALVVSAAVVVAYVAGSTGESHLAFKKGELYYSQPVTESEARSVGEYLIKREYFSDSSAATVRLDRKDGRYRLQLVIDPAYADDPLMLIDWGLMGSEISTEVLESRPIEVVLSDTHIKPIKTVPASAKLTFGMGELFYIAPATAEDARAVGDSLRRLGFFSDERATSVQLAGGKEGHELRFVVNSSSANDPKTLEAFGEMTRAIAVQALHGQAVLMHLCDDRLRILKSEHISPK